MSLSRGQIVTWLRTIDITNKHCIDIGSGPKDKWARNFTHGKPASYTTIDFCDEADYQLDLNEPFTEKFPKNQVTFCLEVLEHIWNPVQAVKNLADITQEVCYIAVPFINPIHDDWDYLRYTNEWFEKTLPKVGFSLVDCQFRIATTGLDSLKKFYTEEGLRLSRVRHQRGEGHKINLIGLLVSAHK